MRVTSIMTILAASVLVSACGAWQSVSHLPLCCQRPDLAPRVPEENAVAG